MESAHWKVAAIAVVAAWLLLPATNQISVGIGSPLKAAIGQLVSEFTTT